MLGGDVSSGSGSPEQQSGFVTKTYEETSFQLLQGMLTIPRVGAA